MDFKSIISNTTTWMHGLAAAAIGAAVGSVGATIQDPSILDMTPAGLKKVGITAAIAGAIAAAGYLTKSPIPWDAQQGARYDPVSKKMIMPPPDTKK